jgi:hypothetical protein
VQEQRTLLKKGAANFSESLRTNLYGAIFKKIWINCKSVHTQSCNMALPLNHSRNIRIYFTFTDNIFRIKLKKKSVSVLVFHICLYFEEVPSTNYVSFSCFFCLWFICFSNYMWRVFSTCCSFSTPSYNEQVYTNALPKTKSCYMHKTIALHSKRTARVYVGGFFYATLWVLNSGYPVQQLYHLHP